MNDNIDTARRMLAENNSVGMSSKDEPIQWNLHNAISALIKGVEEENEKLSERVSALEKILHKN